MESLPDELNFEIAKSMTISQYESFRNSSKAIKTILPAKRKFYTLRCMWYSIPNETLTKRIVKFYDGDLIIVYAINLFYYIIDTNLNVYIIEDIPTKANGNYNFKVIINNLGLYKMIHENIKDFVYYERDNCLMIIDDKGQFILYKDDKLIHSIDINKKYLLFQIEENYQIYLLCEDGNYYEFKLLHDHKTNNVKIKKKMNIFHNSFILNVSDNKIIITYESDLYKINSSSKVATLEKITQKSDYYINDYKILEIFNNNDDHLYIINDIGKIYSVVDEILQDIS